jgi:hypothetical protein
MRQRGLPGHRGGGLPDDRVRGRAWLPRLRDVRGTAARCDRRTHLAGELTTQLRHLRSAATCANAGAHSGGCEIHGEDGVAGSIPAGGSPQPSSSGRARRSACGLPESCWTPFARGLPARFVRVAWWWHLPLRRGDHGDQPRPVTRMVAGGRQGKPHHSSAGADDHGCRETCQKKRRVDVGVRPGMKKTSVAAALLAALTPTRSHPRRALQHRCCRCGSAQVFSRGLSVRRADP